MFGKLLKGVAGAVGGGAKAAGGALAGAGGAIRDANRGPGPWGGKLGKRPNGGAVPLGGAAGAGAAVGEAMGGGAKPSGDLVEGRPQRRIMGMPVGRSPVLDAVKAAGPALSSVFGNKRNKRKKTARGGKR